MSFHKATALIASLCGQVVSVLHSIQIEQRGSYDIKLAESMELWFGVKHQQKLYQSTAKIENEETERIFLKIFAA